MCVFCTRFNWEWRKAKHQAMFVAKTKGTSKEATSRVMSVAEAKTHYAKFSAKFRTWYQAKASKETTSRVMSVAEAKTHYAKFKEFRTWYQAKTGINLFDKRFVIGAVTFKTKVIMQSSFCV